jgi:hypothetical protein
MWLSQPAGSPHGPWLISNSPALDIAFPNAFLPHSAFLCSRPANCIIHRAAVYGPVRTVPQPHVYDFRAYSVLIQNSGALISFAGPVFGSRLGEAQKKEIDSMWSSRWSRRGNMVIERVPSAAAASS